MERQSISALINGIINSFQESDLKRMNAIYTSEPEVLEFFKHLPLLAGFTVPQAQDFFRSMINEYKEHRDAGLGSKWILENLTCIGIWKEFSEAYKIAIRNPTYQNVDMASFLFNMAYLNTALDILAFIGIAKATEAGFKITLNKFVNLTDNLGKFIALDSTLPFSLQSVNGGIISTVGALATTTEARVSLALISDVPIAMTTTGIAGGKISKAFVEPAFSNYSQFMASNKKVKIIEIDTGWLKSLYDEGIDLEQALRKLKKQLELKSEISEIYISDATYQEFINQIADKEAKGKVLHILNKLKVEGVIDFKIPGPNYAVDIANLKETYSDLITNTYEKGVPGVVNNPRIGAADSRIIAHIQELSTYFGDDVSFLILTSDISDMNNLRNALKLSSGTLFIQSP